MKISAGIVGLPNTGKSTLFKLLTKQEVNIAAYPFATIDPNVGVVPVPDNRLDKIAEKLKIKNKIPPVIELYDIAGLIKGAHKGEGLGNQFLGHIREVDAVIVVLRAFHNPEVAAMTENIDPLKEFEIIHTELALKDLESIDKILQKLVKEIKAGRKEATKHRQILEDLCEKLNYKQHLLEHTHDEIVKEAQLLTAKRRIYLINGREEEVSPELRERIKKIGSDYLIANLAELEELPELINKTYSLLEMITFFTIAGEKEVRGWGIRKNTSVLNAAGEIHSDFKQKFIRAEVINWQDLLVFGSWQVARQKGKIRQEGREYIVQDGDVILIHHS